MSDAKFEYDVAFSFHSLDEGLATELNDLIQDRFKTFLYSEQQKVLAGTDGEETFNRIFKQQARLVVIFARKEWGETPFTRIEQTAIRARAFDDGYDFTLFIPTAGHEGLPPWLPPNRLWFGLDRYGMEGAAAVVEARLQELGSEPRTESVMDRAARFQRAKEFAAAKKEFERSFEGVRQADTAFANSIGILGSKVAEISNNGRGELKQLRLLQFGSIWLLFGIGGAMTIDWRRHYANSLDEAAVVVGTFDGVPALPGRPVFDKPRSLQKWKFEYSLLSVGRFGYADVANRRRTFTEDALADHLLKAYIDTAEKLGRRNT